MGGGTERRREGGREGRRVGGREEERYRRKRKRSR